MGKVKYSALCCYFGSWPTFFDIWLNSCKYNENITFFLITDISLKGHDVPDNVKPIKMSFVEIQNRIHKLFDEEIKNHNGKKAYIEVPYKLCEYKTAYGDIFSDVFEGYDYWGYYDIDTIWGDIQKFIPQNPNSKYVKIFPCGHLCFIRNDEKYTKIYRLVNDILSLTPDGMYHGYQVKPWQDAFSEPNPHFYDEEGGLEPLAEYLKKDKHEYIFHHVDFDNVLPPWKFDHFRIVNSPDEKFVVYKFLNGTLLRMSLKGFKVNSKEISYMHLSRRKMEIYGTNYDNFIVYPNKIISNREVTLPRLILYGRTRYLCNLSKRMFAKLKRILHSK